MSNDVCDPGDQPYWIFNIVSLIYCSGQTRQMPGTGCDVDILAVFTRRSASALKQKLNCH